jgi:hypothetical protein
LRSPFGSEENSERTVIEEKVISFETLPPRYLVKKFTGENVITLIKSNVQLFQNFDTKASMFRHSLYFFFTQYAKQLSREDPGNKQHQVL